MSEPVANADLRGLRVAMLVWNGFVYDARVTREAETLAAQDVEAHVVCILTDLRPIAEEKTAAGISVHRVSRTNRWLTRILLAPRVAVSVLSGRKLAQVRSALGQRSRWWELDRKLAMALEMLGGNIRMMVAAVKLKPDVVHANDVNTLVPGWLAARLTGARLVYDAHEISADREGYTTRVSLVKMIEKRLGGSADGYLTTTRTRARWFEENYGYVDMGVVQNRPMLTEVTGSLIRDRFDIPLEEVIVLYQGGLQPGRGLHNLVAAIRSISGAHLVFVGDGVQRSSLEQAASDISDKVHFVGQVPLAELPGWTASADIGVQVLRNTCLNHYSTDSNKLFEYVMGGLAVVASKFPEIEKVVEESALGVLVDPDSVDEIGAAIRELVENSERRRQYRQNALAAREHLDWKSQVPQFLDVYRRAISRDG